MDYKSGGTAKAVITDSTSQLMEQMQREFERGCSVAVMPRNHSTTALIVPKVGHLPQRHLVFTDTQNETKALLYRMIVAAYNYAFTDRFAPKSSRETLNSTVAPFVEYLNEIEIQNKYELLKNYEAYRFDVKGNHGGFSALTPLKTIFTYSFQDESFVAQLSTEDMQFLNALRDTKKSPNINKKQISLSSYFGALPWLRDENVGIGADLYNFFASPKLTVNSLKCLSATVILEFYEAKCQLKTFLKANDDLAPFIQKSIDHGKSKKGTRSARRVARQNAITQIMHAILSTYHELDFPSPSLEKAISLLLCSVSTTTYVDKVQDVLKSKDAFEKILCNKSSYGGGGCSLDRGHRVFSAELDTPMLSMEVLLALTEKDDMPITTVEKLMFSWLMACLTVQPSDIEKLTQSNFRYFKVGGRITDIECEYFKGRANSVHATRSLSVKRADGKALLVYLNQNPGNNIAAHQGNSPSISSGCLAVAGSLVNVMNLPFMSDALQATHQHFGNVPNIMPKAITSLIRNGLSVSKCDYRMTLEQKQKLMDKSDTACASSIFGLKAIKNSAVHAYSDPYTLHYLINRNSHTNKTEKEHYLNADNETWMNASGRITRSVMHDLINNVFDLNFSDLAEKEQKNAEIKFNNEFESITNIISYKTEEMLSRMKIVTEQTKGSINEVGILSQSIASTAQFAPIYVLDSPSTVCKMYNYLHEFEKNYKRLLGQNPHHLYQSAMPTAEWIQQVLASESLSRESKNQGKALFEKMHLSGVSMQVFHSL